MPTEFRTLAVALLLLAAVAPGEATEYFVRTSGDDANDGTSPATAFLTPDRAAKFVAAGDTVYIGGGVHTGKVTQAYRSGTPAAPILWLADADGSRTGDPGPVTLRPSEGTYAWMCFGCSDVIVRGVRFAGNPAYPGATGLHVRSDDGALRLENCAFDGLAIGCRVSDFDKLTLDGCTFTDCTGGVYAGDSVLDLTGCTFVGPDGGTTYAVQHDYCTLTMTGCDLTGGAYGVYAGFTSTTTLTDCDMADARIAAVYWDQGTLSVDGGTYDGNDVAFWFPGGGSSAPTVQNALVRDGRIGIRTGWPNLPLRNLVLSGHSEVALEVDPALASFTLGSDDTVACTGNAVGLSWERSGLGGTLTVAGQTWADNGDHVRAVKVASADVRDCAFTGGGHGVFDDNGGALTVRDCTFRDIADPAGQGGVRADCPTLTVSGCLFERCSNGLRVRDAVDPDVRDCTFRDSAFAGMEIGYGSWNWTAADNLTFVGNLFGVYATRLDLDVDGGAAGIEIVGPVSGGTGVYAFVGSTRSLTLRNLRATSCATGLRVHSPNGAILEDCSASDCSAYGVHITHDSSNPAPVAAVVRNFTATGCANGLGYIRSAGVPAGQGQIELRGVTATKPVAVDADGYPGATSGTGIYLDGCPLDPAYHTDLTVEGFLDGVYVRVAEATLTAAMNVDPSRCRNGVIVVAGACTATDYVSAATRYGLYLVPYGNPVTLTDCDLTALDRAVYVREGGDFSATGCTFESRDDDGVLLETSATAPTVTFTNCTVTNTGYDAIDINFSTGGTFVFTDCVVAAASEDGFDVTGVGAGSGTATFVRCTVGTAGDDGFDLDGPAGVMRDCTVTSAGDDAFTLHRATADVADCVALAAGSVGFLLRDCPVGSIARCAAFDCLSAGVETQAACGTVTVDNLLCVNCEDGLQCETTAGMTTFRHCTAVTNDDAARVYAGDATYLNCVLVGADTGVKVSGGGSAALDHVLIDSPTPYHGVSAGANDVLKAPLFRDAAGGDYRLAEGSPAINAGKDLSGTVDDDLLGQPRPSHRRHDLGAYEYQEAGGSLRILDWRERAE